MFTVPLEMRVDSKHRNACFLTDSGELDIRLAIKERERSGFGASNITNLTLDYT